MEIKGFPVYPHTKICVSVSSAQFDLIVRSSQLEGVRFVVKLTTRGRDWTEKYTQTLVQKGSKGVCK